MPLVSRSLPAGATISPTRTLTCGATVTLSAMRTGAVRLGMAGFALLGRGRFLLAGRRDRLSQLRDKFLQHERRKRDSLCETDCFAITEMQVPDRKQPAEGDQRRLDFAQ